MRLHAAPSQRAYLPAWLAAPLGRRKPADGEGQAAPALGALPPIAEHGSGISSRRISGDLSYLRSSAAAPPPPPSRESWPQASACCPARACWVRPGKALGFHASSSISHTLICWSSCDARSHTVLQSCRRAAHTEHGLGAAAADARDARGAGAAAGRQPSSDAPRRRQPVGAGRLAAPAPI